MIGSFIYSAFWLLQEEFQSEELNALKCQSASRYYLIICLTIAALSAGVGVVVKLYADRRHMLGGPPVRLGVTAAIAFALSLFFVWLEPVKDEVLQSCRESNEWSRYVIMPDATAISRGLVLGGLAAVVIYFLILIVLRMRTKA
jgi:hypothetical protein